MHLNFVSKIFFLWCCIFSQNFGHGAKEISQYELLSTPVTHIPFSTFSSLCGYDNLLSGLTFRADDVKSALRGQIPAGRPLKVYKWGRVERTYSYSSSNSQNPRTMTKTVTTVSKRSLQKLEKNDQSLRRRLLDYLMKKNAQETSSCCSTEWWAVSPVDVRYNGTTYSVYHPSEDEFQIYFEGLCESPGSACMNGGVCAEDRSAYVMILVLDHLNLVSWPPLRYIPMTSNNYCFCTR